MNRAELIAKLEAAEGPSRELDAEIYMARHPTQPWEHIPDVDRVGHIRRKDGQGGYVAAPHYTGSLDAALTLVPDDMWPATSWRWNTGVQNQANYDGPVAYIWKPNPKVRPIMAKGATPAIALVIAALRAKDD